MGDSLSSANRNVGFWAGVSEKPSPWPAAISTLANVKPAVAFRAANKKLGLQGPR